MIKINPLNDFDQLFATNIDSYLSGEKNNKMIWLFTFLLILLLFFCYIIFAPFYLEIDSSKNLMQIRFHYLAKAQLIVTDSSLIMELNMAGWKKQFDLFKQSMNKEKPVKLKQKRKSKRISFSKMNAILRSFKINRFAINLDFDNMVWNAILFPLFYWLSRISRKQFRINYIGLTEIKLQIENNLARVVWAFLFKK